MKILKKNLRVAVVQASPVMVDKDATLDKVVSQIAEAGTHGAELIVFPESLVPCYPYGLTFGFNVGSRSEDGRKDWKIYYDNSVVVPSADTDRIGKAALRSGTAQTIPCTAQTSSFLPTASLPQSTAR